MGSKEDPSHPPPMGRMVCGLGSRVTDSVFEKWIGDPRKETKESGRGEVEAREGR